MATLCSWLSGFTGWGRTSIERNTPARARFFCVSTIFSSEYGSPSFQATWRRILSESVTALPRRIVLPKKERIPSSTV